MPGKSIRVAAAVIRRGDAVLIARRRAGSLAGFWEFPGGKIENGESVEACLARELFEELSVRVEVGRYLGTSRYAYPELEVELIAHWARLASGELAPVDHDAVAWVAPAELAHYRLAPADVPFIAMIEKEVSHVR